MKWWQHFSAAFSETECEQLKTYALSLPAHQGTIGHGGTSAVNETIRRSNVRWLRRDDPSLYWLFARVERLALQANANGFGFELSGQSGGFHEVQFTEYDARDQAHYDWHNDNSWNIDRPFDRKMSMVLQLTRPAAYEGGHLELHNDPLPAGVFTQQGDVIFFPSFNRHRVAPLTRGVRHSLVTWFIGPKLR